MATAVAPTETSDEPTRAVCGSCLRAVLIVLVPAVPRQGTPAYIVTAEPYEWQPRAACESCAWTRARLGRAVDCSRCGGSGYVGEKRPPGRLLAIDVAWSDEGHIRLIGPRSKRRSGEALYPLHDCDQSAIVALPEHTDERQPRDRPSHLSPCPS